MKYASNPLIISTILGKRNIFKHVHLTQIKYLIVLQEKGYKIYKSQSYASSRQIQILITTNTSELYKHEKAPTTYVIEASLFERRRLPTLPHCIAVPSAQVGLTSLFGMGRGGTPPQ